MDGKSYPGIGRKRKYQCLKNSRLQCMKSLKNKTVWITGASGGIGKEMAIQMANAGAKIILTARSVEKLNAIKDSLKGDGHLICPMDLSKTEEIPSTVKKVVAKAKTIDVLVNNAGISQRSLAKDTQLEVDRKIMELDYFSKVILTKSLLPHMIENQQGLIVSISSVLVKLSPNAISILCCETRPYWVYGCPKGRAMQIT